MTIKMIDQTVKSSEEWQDVQVEVEMVDEKIYFVMNSMNFDQMEMDLLMDEGMDLFETNEEVHQARV